MRILHCINDITSYGGAEKIVKNLTSSSEHFSMSVIPSKNSSFFLKLLVLMKSSFVLFSKRNEYDFFHFHLFPSFYLSIFIPSRKVVIHEHNTHNRRRNYKFFRLIENCIYKRAFKVICISDSTKSSLDEWVGPLKNAVVLSNFTRFDYFKYPIPNSDVIHITMIASLTDQKKQDLLIKSFSHLPENYHLSLLGDGPNKSRLQNLTQLLDLQERVIFFGNVDNVEEHIKKSTLCVLLSNWEGFGMVAVESSSFNRVTLCSDVLGLSTVVKNPDLLIGNSASSSEVAERILSLSQKIISTPSHFEIYCREKSEEYSFSNFMKKLNNIYR